MSPPVNLKATWPCLAALAWLAFTGWARPLSIPDEGRYAGVAWGMVTSGDWLVPHLNGLPYFHKPPLFYWLTALSMELFGPVEWAARIASWLGAAAATTALYLFARRWRNERFARFALLAFATQLLVFVGAQFANLDMLVAGCITVTTLAFAHGALLREAGESPKPTLVIGYLFAAFGVLAKGLIGIVLPGLVIVVWLLVLRRWRVLLSLAWWPGALLFLVVAAPWFVLMQREFPDFLHYFFYVQHFARYAQGGFNNQQPAYFYAAVLLALAFPWSLWMLAGLRRRPASGSPEREAGLRALAWAWLAVVTLFFSLPQSKLVGYIFPAAAPLALLAADAFFRTGQRRRIWRISAAVAAAFCVAAVIVGTLRPVHSTREIGTALRQRGPADKIVFLKHYWFDIPLYARLAHPVLILDDWKQAATEQRDNWRKELSDASVFAPAVGRQLLVLPEHTAQILCTAAPIWVVGDKNASSEEPILAAAEQIAAQGDTRLWLLPGLNVGPTRPGCPETPSLNSRDKS
jgi:4-amino-4-deoxy-L-arabinose transferase-like glycosyltransferase